MDEPVNRVKLLFKRSVWCCLLAVVFAAAVAAQAPGTADLFRVEKVGVDGGAEIVTIFAQSGLLVGSDGADSKEVPMVSVLRDTLGDQIPENDKLRYVWMHTYSKPTFWQNAAAVVPFLYTRTSGQTKVSGTPPPLIDMQRSNKAMWNQVLWSVFKSVVRSELGLGGKLPASQYHRNLRDRRRTAAASALTILALYQSLENETLLSETELQDIQARLMVDDRPLGWHMKDENLPRVYAKEMATAKFKRGTNWELLRQYSEQQRLYFDPIEMPDGEARHAMVWVAAEDLKELSGRQFDPRFLNIRSPWNDASLRNWKGYTQTWWFDADNRQVEAGAEGARSRTMIPLALYGLDNPKIPTILIDFRDGGNPKRREMSRRILRDAANNVAGLSAVTGVPYFVARSLYSFVTGRRGTDLDQRSRQRSYAQLKMLLALDNQLDAGLEDEIVDRIEKVSINPLENDTVSQLKVAEQQYKNLMDYARRPNGLPAKLDRERREEMVKLAHSSGERFFYDLGHVLSFGLYKHREKAAPEMLAKMDMRRQLDHHERVLMETAYNSSDPDIDSDSDAVRRALQFVSQNGSAAKTKTSRALARLFRIAPDDEMRSMALAGLYRINNSSAKKELLAIYNDPKFDANWRDTSAKYLRKALGEGQRISKRDAAAISTIAAN
jgi:hypothetical protein